MLSDNWWRAIIPIFLIFGCDRTSSECIQLSPCSCMNEDGMGFDLSSLKHYGYLATEVKSNTSNAFYFHPCENYNKFPTSNLTTNDCNDGTGTSLCMHDASTNKYVNLGTAEETTITQTENPVLVFKHGAVTTTVELSCCESCTTPLFIEVDAQHLILHILKPCKVVLARSLSTGSILVIMFFVFAGVYFIGGAVAIKLLKGATGWQLLPNHEFWLGLPGLVKDGVIFTFNRCKTDSYDRI